jgi:putative ABC transport system substrate-binding protein
MILRPDVLKKAANATGVVLEFPTETQLQWIRKVLPKAQSVGVVFNPAENREQVERAGRAAQKLGLKLEVREVPAPKDLPAALDQLANNTDVLWGIADTTALNPQTAKLIFLFSFRNRVPFVGPSSAWVKAGALYSLDWDYADMGAQCGELAQKVLQGAQAGSLPPVPPRKVLYSVNRKTAEDMAVKVPDEILRGAATLY